MCFLILIQNISESGVPNLIAVETFCPDQIVWVYAQRLQHVFERMKKLSKSITDNQIGWIVDDNDPNEMQSSLMSGFAKLPANNKIIYHLAGGPRSIVLHSMKVLEEFHRESGTIVEGVIYDHSSQSFDVMYPLARNDAYPCAKLSLEKMLHSHDNHLDNNRPMKSLKECRKNIDSIEKLKTLAPEVKQAMRGKNMQVVNQQGNGRSKFQVVVGKTGRTAGLPGSLISAYKILQDMKIIQDLSVKGNVEVSFNQQNKVNAYGYINGGWLEDWLGAVLSELKWDGTGIGAQILIGHKHATKDSDTQELDFLGVRNNHLVYWSCKHTARLTPEQLFEVDALRDEICGDVDHTAAICHAGEMTRGMLMKAKRLGVRVVNVWDDDAKEQILRICR